MRLLVFNVDLWIGTARLPRELRRAGFEVAALCPSGVFLAATSHVDARYIIPDGDARTVTKSRSDAMDRWQPDLVIPGDERVVHFLHRIVDAHAENRLVGLSEEAADTVARSLPDRRHFAATMSKHAFMTMAVGLGIAIPAFREVFTLADALGFAEEHGYPVVLKMAFGNAGAGVRTCAAEEDLVGNAMEFLRLYYKEGSAGERVFVQRYVHGAVGSVAGVAYQGRLLGGATSRKTLTDPPVTGPSTVRTFESVPGVLEGCAKFVEATHFTGFFGMDYMRESSSEQTYLIECNPRPTPQCHVAAVAGVDLCAALYAGMTGGEIPPQELREGLNVALYPQEIIRDPDSDVIKNGFHDVPEDDPDLLAAYDAYVAKARLFQAASC